MQRVVLAALFVAAVIAVGAILLRMASRYFEASADGSRHYSGDAMQRVAFFLLLALMAYVIASGGT